MYVILHRSSQHLKCFSSLTNIWRATHATTSTVDPKEMDNFKRLRSTWWDENGQMKSLHSLNQLRVPFIRDCLINTGTVESQQIDTPKPLINTAILEVGCGGGILTEALARLGSNVTGIDANSDLLKEAELHIKLDPQLSNLTYILESIENHAPNNLRKYDAVVASEVVEHVANKETFLTDCTKCLKPGGSIFITTLNKTFVSWLGGIIAAEYILNLVPRGTHDWDKFIPPHQIQKILEDNNCRTRIIHGMCYNFLLNKWCWTTDTSINYALHAVRDKEN